MFTNNHISLRWTIQDNADGNFYALPGQPVSVDDGKPIASGSRVKLTCMLLQSSGTCQQISNAVKLGVAAPVE